MHIQKVIEKLGYSPAEVAVYLASLRMGESTIADIARNVRLPRTSVQAIVEKLHERGLLNYHLQHRRRSWTAENPDKLMIALRESEAALSSVLPDLKAMRHPIGSKPGIKLYHGVKEIWTIYRDLFETKHPILCLMPWDAWLEVFGEEELHGIISERRRRFLRIRVLTTRSKKAEELKRNDARELRSTRFLSPDAKLSSATFIFGTKVTLVSLQKEFPIAIIIEDGAVAATMTMLFESLWSQSKE